MPVTFKEISTLGEPLEIEVCDGTTVVGHIRRRLDTGDYCYYPVQATNSTQPGNLLTSRR